MHYLYKITNKINNKVYIGQSVAPKRRWNIHQYLANAKPVQYIHRAMNKYGIANFSFEIIDFGLNQWHADCLEINIIQQYDSRNKEKGYNVAPGGEVVSGISHFRYGVPWSEEKRKQISQSLKNLYFSGYQHPGLGTQRPAEIIEKMKPTMFKTGEHCSPKTEFKPGHNIRTSRNALVGAAKRTEAEKQYLSDLYSYRSCKRVNGKIIMGPKLTDEQLNAIKSDTRSSRLIAVDYGIGYKLVQKIKKNHVLT